MSDLICLDHVFRRWGAISLFGVFALGLLLTWATTRTHAQTPEENSSRISGLESWRKDQTDDLRNTAVMLSDHDRRMAVMETILKEHTRQLEEVSAYGKWLVLGVFGLLGIKAWERVVGQPTGRQIEIDTKL